MPLGIAHIIAPFSLDDKGVGEGSGEVGKEFKRSAAPLSRIPPFSKNKINGQYQTNVWRRGQRG
jgi:hypothetical protein